MQSYLRSLLFILVIHSICARTTKRFDDLINLTTVCNGTQFPSQNEIPKEFIIYASVMMTLLGLFVFITLLECIVKGKKT